VENKRVKVDVGENKAVRELISSHLKLKKKSFSDLSLKRSYEAFTV